MSTLDLVRHLWSYIIYNSSLDFACALFACRIEEIDILVRYTCDEISLQYNTYTGFAV